MSLSSQIIDLAGKLVCLRSLAVSAVLLRQGFGGQPAARSALAGWWSQTGSNRRPHACKARALPTELWPLMKPRPTWEPRLGASSTCSPEGSMVGPGRLELPTSRLSGVCSNHLSYRPLKRHVQATPEDPSPDTRSHHNLNRLRCLAERETKTATSCLPVYVYDEPVRP